MANIRKFRVGANLKICDLKEHAAWIIESQRDVELFDASVGEVLDGNWRKLALEVQFWMDIREGRVFMGRGMDCRCCVAICGSGSW